MITLTESRRWPQVTIGVIGAIALLLLGAAGGMLLTSPSNDEAQQPQPTTVDIGFAQDMSLHHQQAVTMATLARERASSVDVRQLAFDIETNQRDQIGRMQGWLTLWNQPAHADGPAMQWMHSGGGHDHSMTMNMAMPGGGAMMPGMASSEEMTHLQALQGPDFDVFFLQLMLRHHMGGASMAEFATQQAATPAVRSLAENMLGAQGNEMTLMKAMLQQRGAQPLPAN